MIKLDTADSFINNHVRASGFTAGDLVSVEGYHARGDLGAGTWIALGTTGTASVDPLTNNTPNLSDASGNEFALVGEGVIDLNVLGGTGVSYQNIADAAGLTYSQGLTSNPNVSDRYIIADESGMVNRSSPQVDEAYIVSDRANGIFDTVTTGTTPDVDEPNGSSIVVSVADATKCFVFRPRSASLMRKSDEEAEVSTDELVTSSGWVLGANWSGDYATGFTHATGSSETLELNLPALESGSYEVTWRCVSPSDSKVSNSGYTIELGGSGPFEIYEGNFFDHEYNRGIRALTANTLIVITPESQFDGTLSEISVKKIISNRAPTIYIEDSNGDLVYEVSPTKEGLDNVYIGKNNSLKNTTGNQSVGIGFGVLQANTTGFWNVGIGALTLNSNTVGSRNIALGYVALQNCISGHRNIALGSFSLKDVQDGHNNIGIGADVMQNNVNGHGNIALGLSSCAGGADITGNVGIGYACMVSVETDGNVGIGYEAGYYLEDGEEQIAIGEQTLRQNVSGIRNLVIGHNSFNDVSATDPQRNVVIGTNAMTSAGNCDFNTIIGNNAAENITTAESCIIIGYNVQAPSATSDFRLNIGNLLHGRMGSGDRRLGVDVESPLAALHLPASDGSTNSAPLRIDEGTLLTTPADGTIEYDGTNLYFTDNTNTRRTISFT